MSSDKPGLPQRHSAPGSYLILCLSPAAETAFVRICSPPFLKVVESWQTVYGSIQNKLYCAFIQIKYVGFPCEIIFLLKREIKKPALMNQCLGLFMYIFLCLTSHILLGCVLHCLNEFWATGSVVRNLHCADTFLVELLQVRGDLTQPNLT